MIEYYYEIDFKLWKEHYYSDWLGRVIRSENKELGALSFIFCDDNYLLDMNVRYLKHNTFTDVITFDYSEREMVSGDVFVSIERVQDNAVKFGVDFDVELRRVMVHGVLHLLGYKDKTKVDASTMREKEEEKIKLFHVEH